MRKNVWIFNHYSTSMLRQKGGRHYSFSKYLKQNGYNPTIFCSSVYHGNGQDIDCGKDLYKVDMDENAKFVYIKTTKYKGNGFSRIKNMLNFTRNLMKVAKLYVKDGGEKTDVIISSSVHPLTFVAVIKIAKKLGVPCIVEIRDLWPESIVEYSSKLSKKNIIIKLLYKGEKWIYKKADKIIFTMEGGKDYIIEQGWNKEIDINKVYHINNGVDLKQFDQNKENFQIEDEDLDDENLFKVVYAGSIRTVNNLGILLDAAKEIENTKVKILIWGDGNELDLLKGRVVNEKIGNVKFKGRVEKKYIPNILSKADMNILHYGDSGIFKYGTSQNKNFEYLASGKPILNTIKIGYDIVEKNNAGVSCKVQSAKNIGDAITIVANLRKEEILEMRENGRRVAKEYDFANLTKKLIEVIE